MSEPSVPGRPGASARPAADRVTVLGTGAMGSAIAASLRERGLQVTVWNRSPAKTDRLASSGCDIAPTVATAITASPVVLSCLLNTSVLEHVLADPDVSVLLAGKTVVDTSTASPQDVLALGDKLAKAGALQLDAKLMFYPAKAGSDDAVIYVSGPKGLFQRHSDMFATIAGKTAWVGEDMTAASLMYNAVWTYYYSGLFGFLEASAFVRASGLDARTFLELALKSTLDLGEHLREATGRLDRDDLGGDQAALDIYVDGFETMERAFTEAGIPSMMLETLRRLSRVAAEAGFGTSDVAAVTTALLLQRDTSQDVGPYEDEAFTYLND